MTTYPSFNFLHLANSGWKYFAFLFLICSFSCTTSASGGDLGELTHSCMLDYNTIDFKILPGPEYESYGSIIRKLGHGASSAVYLLNRTEDHSLVAVKRFPPINPSLSPQRRNELEECIKLEYFIGRMVNGHEGITETDELLFEEESLTWSIVTAYHPRSFMAERRDVSTNDKLQVMKGVISAVRHVHSQGVSYGDVKLENILMTDDGHARLIDFGSSTFAGCQVETPDSGVNVVPGDSGTPPYMPPEVFSVLEYDRQKADIWSLGVLFYVMIVSQMPWRHASFDDDRFCLFLGVAVPKMTSCFYQPFALKEQTCSSGSSVLLDPLPVLSRGVIWDILRHDPDDRPSLDRIMAEWNGSVETSD